MTGIDTQVVDLEFKIIATALLECVFKAVLGNNSPSYINLSKNVFNVEL